METSPLLDTIVTNEICLNQAIQKKGFYNRETIAVLNYEIQQMSFIYAYPHPFFATIIIKPFFISRISVNHDKVERLLANAMVKSL